MQREDDKVLQCAGVAVASNDEVDDFDDAAALAALDAFEQQQNQLQQPAPVIPSIPAPPSASHLCGAIDAACTPLAGVKRSHRDTAAYESASVPQEVASSATHKRFHEVDALVPVGAADQSATLLLKKSVQPSDIQVGDAASTGLQRSTSVRAFEV